jgi:NitT/TauT family transport system ATP-binding protein
VLELLGVGKAFDEGAPVLVDVSLRVKAGEFWCVVGPSGCGKSTLLHLIAGFEQPTGGAVRFRDQPVRRPGRERGVVFQDAGAALFPWLTAAENVEFGLKLQGAPAPGRAATVERYLRLVGLDAHRQKYPRQLSGGMQQRLQIARALALEPTVLLMDEPFASLDAHTRERMHAELLRIWEVTGTTVVFVTHDISEAVTLGDHIAVLSGGPGATIRRVFTVDLPRPRDPAVEGFSQVYAQVRALFG